MKQMKRLLVVLVAMVFALGFSGIAQATPFQNGSFEKGTYNGPTGNNTTGYYDFDTVSATGNPTVITGWTVVSGSIDWIKSYWDASDGDFSIDLDGNGIGTIEQTFDTAANTWYQVQFDMAGNPDAQGDKNLDAIVLQSPGMNAESSHGYSFNSSGHTRHNTNGDPGMGWITNSFVFHSLYGGETTLKFKSDTYGSWGAAIDNVRVNETTAPVPEPATMLLLGTGLIGLAGFKRKGFFKKAH